MSDARLTKDDARPASGGAFNWDLAFLTGWAGPLMLVARGMLAYIFIVDGAGAILWPTNRLRQKRPGANNSTVGVFSRLLDPTEKALYYGCTL